VGDRPGFSGWSFSPAQAKSKNEALEERLPRMEEENKTLGRISFLWPILADCGGISWVAIGAY